MAPPPSPGRNGTKEGEGSRTTREEHLPPPTPPHTAALLGVRGAVARANLRMLDEEVSFGVGSRVVAPPLPPLSHLFDATADSEHSDHVSSEISLTGTASVPHNHLPPPSPSPRSGGGRARLVRLDSRDIGADEAFAQEAVYGVTPLSTSRARFHNGNGSENGSAGGSGRRAQGQVFSFARGVPITTQASPLSPHRTSDAAARVVACERPYAVKRRASAAAAALPGASASTARMAIVRSKQVAPAEPPPVLDSCATILPVDAAPCDSVVEVDATVPRSVTLPGGALGNSSTATLVNGPRFGAAGVYAALVGAQLCWSGFHVLAKFAFLNMHPMAMPMLRAIGTTPLLFLICCYTEGRDFWRAVSRSDLKILALLGTILCCGTQNLFNIGLQLTTATDGGMSQPAVPVFAAFMSILLGREKSSWGKVCGIGCAILGTLCIVLGETYLLPASASPSDEDPSSALTSGGGSASANGNDLHDVSPAHRVLGLLCFTLQTFLFAVYMLLQKPLLARLPTLTITFYTFFFGQVGASLVGGYFVAQIDWAHLPIMWFVSVAYTILFSTVAGFLLFGYATKHLPATAASTGITLQPLFSSVLGAIVLGDVITYMHIVGGLFLIAGLIIVIRARSKEARQATREATDTAAAEALAAATAAQEDLSSTAPLPSSSSSVEEEFGTTTSLERADEAVQEHEEAEELMIELAHRGGGSSGVPPRLPSDGHPVPTEAKTSRLSFDENPFEL